MWRLILSLLLCLGMGCTEPDAPETLRVILDWWPNPVHVPLYVAMEKGLFAEVGLSLKILKSAEPPQVLPMLQAGRADIALTSTPNALIAISKGHQLIRMGVLIDQPLRSFLFLKESGIRDHADLHGCVLGGNPEGLLTAYVRSMMRSRQIVLREVRPMNWDIPAALLTHAVDVVSGCFWNIETQQLQAVGVETGFFRIQEFGVPHYEELMFVACRDVVGRRPDLQRRFQQALATSINWCRGHPEEAFALYLQAHPDKTQRVRQWESAAWSLTAPLLAQTQQADRAQYMAFTRWLIEEGLCEEEGCCHSLLGEPSAPTDGAAHG